jgi:uncharacterized membrane-anchored protein
VTGWLRLALAAQLGFLGIWGASLLTSHRDATVVWLATEPVDPRDLLSGHYVALRYSISTPTAAGCEAHEDAPGDRAVYVRLEKSGEIIDTNEGPAEISAAIACQSEPPIPSPGEQWVVGRTGTTSRPGEIVYGIERFYLPETSSLREARSGDVVAKVVIANGFEARIVDLARVATSP